MTGRTALIKSIEIIRVNNLPNSNDDVNDVVGDRSVSSLYSRPFIHQP